MNRFETHVFATVRVKVAGTNFSADPQIIGYPECSVESIRDREGP